MHDESEHPHHHDHSRLARNSSPSKLRFLVRLTRYRNLLFRKGWLLMLGVAVGLVLTLVLSRSQPPSYISTSKMIVSIKLAIPEGSVYTEELNNFLGTQAALMQSGVVINRAHTRVTAKRPELRSQPVSLKVTVTPRTSIFLLQAVGDDPEYTRTFLQAAMEEYINLKKDMRTRTSDTTVAGLTEEVVRLEKDLRRAEEEIAAFQSTNSVVLLQEQGNSAGSYLAALNQRLASLRSEYKLIQALTLDQNLDRRQQISEGSLGSSTSSASVANDSAAGSDRADSEYAKARQQILLLKADQADMGQYLKPRHPKMIALAEEIARREKMLEILRQQSAEQLGSRKLALDLQIQQMEQDVGEWDTKALEISRKSAEFQKLKVNSQRIQALYDRLLATMQTLDVNKEISPESVTVLEDASPSVADRPNLSKQYLRGAIVGFVLALALLLVLDRLDDKMSTVTELTDLFDEELIGSIPRERPVNSKSGLELIQPADTRHLFIEAFRNIRSSLLFMANQENRPKVLLVTSSVPNEGKSLVSSNLAITLASAGAKVLLIDADLRKGSLHARFQIKNDPGLSEVLTNQVNWAETIRPTKFTGVSLLPRGAVAHNSGELMLSPAAGKLLSETAAKFDFVLVDTAPVMAADDVTSLAPNPLISGVIFVIRAELTSARVARAAMELLYRRQASILGLVFNAVRPTSVGYYYYKYRDYYVTYPDGKKDGKTVEAEVSR